MKKDIIKKVGQKYKVMNDEINFNGGEIVELVRIETDRVSYYKNDTGLYGFLYDFDHELCEVELVEDVEKTFTKDDLKVGYMVESRIGQLAHVIPSLEYDLALSFENGWDTLSIYNDDLMHKYRDVFDIVKVYGFTRNGYKAHEFDISRRELLWELIKEMTLEQIEKELGYKIKLIEKD